MLTEITYALGKNGIYIQSSLGGRSISVCRQAGSEWVRQNFCNLTTSIQQILKLGSQWKASPKEYSSLASIFLAKLEESCNLPQILQVLHKNENFLERHKNLSRALQEKLKDNFLARSDQSLIAKLSYNFSCKILARFFYVYCKKSFIFSARLPRYVKDILQDLASLARKTLARLEYFLQDCFY